MRTGALGTGRKVDDYTRLHALFVGHFGHAVGFAWAVSLYAALQAPWVSNLRGLIDPAGRAESTGAFLFTLPVIMTAAWVAALFGGDVLRRSRVLKSDAAEFAVAGAVAFAVFWMAVDRAVAALLLG